MCIYNIYTYIYTAVEKGGQGRGGRQPPPPHTNSVTKKIFFHIKSKNIKFS